MRHPIDLVARLGQSTIGLMIEVGSVVTLMLRVLYWAGRRPWRCRLFLQQMDFVGVGSLAIVLLTGLFSGAVMALQTGYAFRLFNAETLVGSTVAIAMARELGPVFTALMVTARAGSAMAAELGSMRVTEQIDALQTLAVEPVQYLLVPRVLATTASVPLLSILFSFVGCLGAYLVGVKILGINEGLFMANLQWYLEAEDIVDGLIKAVFFGLLLSTISCHRGFYTSGGAQGVGRATNRAVVISSVIILVSDYFMTDWLRIIRSQT